MHDDADDMTHNLALFGITGALGREIQTALEVEQTREGATLQSTAQAWLV